MRSPKSVFPVTRLTSRSDGRGQPLSAVLSGWAARNPRIRRVWLSADPGADSDRHEERISVVLELQPVADSEETLATWMAHGARWRHELRTQLGRPVNLGWYDADAVMAQARSYEARSLIYERAS